MLDAKFGNLIWRHCQLSISDRFSYKISVRKDGISPQTLATTCKMLKWHTFQCFLIKKFEMNCVVAFFSQYCVCLKKRCRTIWANYLIELDLWLSVCGFIDSILQLFNWTMYVLRWCYFLFVCLFNKVCCYQFNCLQLTTVNEKNFNWMTWWTRYRKEK